MLTFHEEPVLEKYRITVQKPMSLMELLVERSARAQERFCKLCFLINRGLVETDTHAVCIKLHSILLEGTLKRLMDEYGEGIHFECMDEDLELVVSAHPVSGHW